MEAIEFDPEALEMEPFRACLERGAIQEQRAVIRDSRCKASEVSVGLQGVLVRSVEESVVAHKGWRVSFVGPGVAETMHVYVPKLHVRDESAEATRGASIDAPIVLIFS